MSGYLGVLAVDGPSGTGKSSVSREVARRLQARYLDTGAMYRALTWAALDRGVPAEAYAAVAETITLEISTDPAQESVTVDGVHVETAIRSAAVTAAVSAVSAVPAVRSNLVARQRELIAAAPAIVVEGRDIGTTVAPEAPLKVFLTAAPEARAARRASQQRVSGAARSALAADLRRRDDFDSTRAASPLRVAPDAVEVDSTDMTRDQVVEHIVALALRTNTTAERQKT